LRVVIQRVRSASVRVDDEVVGAIGPGLLILVGASATDDASDAQRMAAKCAGLRLFATETGRFDASLVESGGAALIVSQFTLLADVRKGRRPSFASAAPGEIAAPLVDVFADALRALGVSVETGHFGAMMQVELVNDGPVTFVIDSDDLDRPRRG
jgi:D-tyrosyl-tRNA(Tyr) deacylase